VLLILVVTAVSAKRKAARFPSHSPISASPSGKDNKRGAHPIRDHGSHDAAKVLRLVRLCDNTRVRQIAAGRGMLKMQSGLPARPLHHEIVGIDRAYTARKIPTYISDIRRVRFAVGR